MFSAPSTQRGRHPLALVLYLGQPFRPIGPQQLNQRRPESGPQVPQSALHRPPPGNKSTLRNARRQGRAGAHRGHQVLDIVQDQQDGTCSALAGLYLGVQAG